MDINKINKLFEEMKEDVKYLKLKTPLIINHKNK